MGFFFWLMRVICHTSLHASLIFVKHNTACEITWKVARYCEAPKLYFRCGLVLLVIKSVSLTVSRHKHHVCGLNFGVCTILNVISKLCI